ncbi:MAG: MBL fold metallo-hydrolase [Bacteroidales bacterium]|nr:MBL fold metallo-hydrolase [Bacteroidales bacterium]
MQKITLLGTGTSQGVPVIGCRCTVCRSDDTKDKRLRTAAFVESDGTRILIDAGPDLRQQLLRENIDSLHAILITHEHKDHLAGLDDVRPIYFMQKSPIDIYAMQRVLKVIRKDFDYAFKEHPYPGAPAFSLHPIRHDRFRVKDVEIQPIQVRHLTLPILGFRIGRIAYITDASFVPDSELTHLHDIDLLVINALRIKEHYSHFNLRQALDFVDKVQPKHAVLTHVSHEMGLYSEVEGLLPENVTLGYDGFSYTTGI